MMADLYETYLTVDDQRKEEYYALAFNNEYVQFLRNRMKALTDSIVNLNYQDEHFLADYAATQHEIFSIQSLLTDIESIKKAHAMRYQQAQPHQT